MKLCVDDLGLLGDLQVLVQAKGQLEILCSLHLRCLFLAILETKLRLIGIGQIPDLPNVIVILIVPSEMLFTRVIYLCLVLLPRQCCPNFISKHADFVISIYVDELLSTEYLPYNLVLIKVVEEYSGIPAWLIFNLDHIAFILATHIVLHQVSCEYNCLSRSTCRAGVLPVIRDCVNDSGVVKLLLIVILFVVYVRNKLCQDAILPDSFSQFAMLLQVS